MATYSLKLKTTKELYISMNIDESILSLVCFSFEKAMSFPHMYSKTLNNAATMYFKLGMYMHTAIYIMYLIYLFAVQCMHHA